jgi:DNA mismatch repair protein MutS
LKELERAIVGAEENAVHLEYALFTEIRARLGGTLPRLQRTAQSVKLLDALNALARLAQENGYVRPRINEERRLDIAGGRHPVVEQSLGRDRFVPNDTALGDDARMMIITGPNMAGKSTYMRQVALIALMRTWAPLYRRRAPTSPSLTASLPASALRTICTPASPPSWWR